MLRVLMAIVVGIMIADRWAFPLWSEAVGFVFLVGGAWLWRRRAVANIYVLMAAAVLAMFTSTLTRPDLTMPARGELMEVVVDDITAHRAEYTSARGRVVSIGDGESCATQVRLNIDPAADVAVGEKITGCFPFTPLTRHSEHSVERYLARQGVVATLYITPQSIMHRSQSAPTLGQRLRLSAQQRIARLGLTPDAESLVRGVTTGDRSTIQPSLRNTYTLSGAGHLLAVSGLHIGFIFFIVNMATTALALLRRGPLLRCLVAIVAIWLYAAMAGFGPSVVRAGVMFTLLQMAMLGSRRGDGLNTLALTACVMLLWDSRWLYDAGFVMSFLSVAAIVEWGIPLTRLRVIGSDRLPRLRAGEMRGYIVFIIRRIGRKVWSAIAITIVASVATMPIVSHYFGVVTLWSIVVGPLMVWLCCIVVAVTMLYVVAGFGPVAPLASVTIEWAASTMNDIATWCASHPSLIFPLRLDTTFCLVAYLIFALITIALWSRSDFINRGN